MPTAAMLTDKMQIPTVSITTFATGEEEATFSYTDAPKVPCKLFDKKAAALLQPWGQDLQVDAVALVAGRSAITPLLGSDDARNRHQVKITPATRIGDTAPAAVIYEVMAVADAGRLGRMKRVILKRQE